ncbi:MAG: DUF4292 domain-containing protein [Muribaculaceae bacterium]|nr:DUF4292 domain-containing protein [Muribaculaceae bacterium]
MKHYNIMAIAVALIALTACGTTKKVADGNNTPGTTIAAGNTAAAPASSKDAQKAITSTFQNWTTMQTGGTFHMGGSKMFSSSVNVRMERDKLICISLRPVLGIEVGKLIFTGDSVYVIDKVHRQYIAENVSMFTNGLPATVSTLQDIFLGRAFILGEGTYDKSHIAMANVTTKDGKYNMTPLKQPKGFAYEFTFDQDSHILALTVVPEGAQSTTYSVNYSDVKSTAAGNVAHSFTIAGTIKGKDMSIQLDYNNITWNKDIKADVSLPTNYKQVDARSLFSALGTD